MGIRRKLFLSCPQIMWKMESIFVFLNISFAIFHEAKGKD